MHWYVLQTKTGGEEKLTGLIRKIIPAGLYGTCFVVYFEQFWRRQQQSMVHIQRAFPGYVFVTTDQPEQLYLSLKQVPAMSKIVADDNLFFLALEKAEAEFLQNIMDERHVIGLSYLATDGHGQIQQVTGPLSRCLPQVVRYNYKKRNVMVRLRLAGAEKQVMLGIVLKEDIRRQLQYGKVEAPIRVPERYRICSDFSMARYNLSQSTRAGEPVNDALGSGAVSQEKKETAVCLVPGDQVIIAEGELAGMTGIVCNVKKHSVKLRTHFLGQRLELEAPAEVIQKIPEGQGQKSGV